MKTKKWLPLIFTFLYCLALVLGQTEAAAESVFKTFTHNGYGDLVQTQDAYVASHTLSVFEEETLNKPLDMKFGPDNHLYVADSGNKRVVVLTKSGELVKIIQHKEFAHPSGLFVDTEGQLYVADDSANKIFMFNKNDQLIHTFVKPTALSFGETAPFSPTKLSVDSRGNIYALSRGNNNGLIMLNPDVEGEFLGYFAPNQTSNSLLTSFRKMIFSEEQLDKMLSTTPDSAANLTIDEQGLIYTITPNENSRNVVKKLNMGGTNLLQDNYIYFPSGISVGNLGNIFVIGEDGYLYEYTSEGEFLFMFAGKDDGKQRRGLIGKGAAVLVDNEGTVFTLDEKKNEIQSFVPTEFTNILHEALELYQNGRYVESKTPWTQVLNMNSQFDFASLGIGEAYYKEENYHEAMTAFRRAKDKTGYSDSFWEVRNVWIREHVITVFFAIIALVVALKLIKKLLQMTSGGRKLVAAWRKFKDYQLIRQLRYLKYYLLHPVDGAYGIRKEGKTSNLSAVILGAVALLIYVVEKYFTGFIFRMTRDGEYTLFQDILMAVLIFGAITVATYLVCTISDGSATFKQLFHGFIYSLAPYIFIKPFVIVVSNVLTQNEAFVLQFANLIVVVWVVVLAFITIMQLNEYSFRETLKIIFLSAFTIFIAALSVFILYSLFQQLYSFITSLYGEAVHRFEN